MRLTISSTFYNFTLLLLSLVFVLLCAVSGSGRVPCARVEGSLPSLHQAQNQTIRKSEPPTLDDSQVKTVLDKMAAAGIALPTTVADVRSEEHTSELQSLAYLVCRLLLEKKNHHLKSALPCKKKKNTLI